MPYAYRALQISEIVVPFSPYNKLTGTLLSVPVNGKLIA
jgi:hypothetical protein